MFDGIPAHWHKVPQKSNRSANEPAYVILGIMLAALSVPATFLGWAIFSSIASILH